MALGRLLVNYQSEWYAELNTEVKRPEWEELNSEMTDDAENYLGYIKNGDEAKRDAYVSKLDASKQESTKQSLEQQRKDYQSFLKDDKAESEKKLIIWENAKEKATKMLRWDGVAKGLTKQSQKTKQSDTEKDKAEDSSKQQAETSSTPATLSQNGRVWFMHPISRINFFSDNKVLFQKGDKDEIIREINIRLVGFGGNVPTDEFTERTENMIKQFQRDYLKDEETEVINMQVIKAIDKFQEEYPIETFFAQSVEQVNGASMQTLITNKG